MPTVTILMDEGIGAVYIDGVKVMEEEDLFVVDVVHLLSRLGPYNVFYTFMWDYDGNYLDDDYSYPETLGELFDIAKMYGEDQDLRKVAGYTASSKYDA